MIHLHVVGIGIELLKIDLHNRLQQTNVISSHGASIMAFNYWLFFLGSCLACISLVSNVYDFASNLVEEICPDSCSEIVSVEL